jgi:hypothetical protein
MINGAHVIIYSRDAEADKAFLKDVLKFTFVDAGRGWLIFRLPPAELAVHPSDENDLRELYLMTDDLDAEIAALKKAGANCATVSQQGWGRSTRVGLLRRSIRALSATPRQTTVTVSCALPRSAQIHGSPACQHPNKRRAGCSATTQRAFPIRSGPACAARGSSGRPALPVQTS